jgi:hypothetical protein
MPLIFVTTAGSMEIVTDVTEARTSVGTRPLRYGFPFTRFIISACRTLVATSPTDIARPGLRAKTVATRLSPEELQEVENAAERDGKSLAEWLRELALRSARERAADPIELLLASYALLNLFHATALAGTDEDHGMRGGLIVSLRRKGRAFTHFTHRAQRLRRKVTTTIESVCLHDHRFRTTFCLRM